MTGTARIEPAPPVPARASRQPALWVYLAVGVVGGFLSGFAGIGGGVVLIPLMVGFLGVTQHRAHGTSLAIIIPTALASAIRYYVAPRGGLEPPISLAVAYAIPAMLGAPLGARLITAINTAALKRLFGVLLMALALRLLIPRSPTSLCSALGLDPLPGCPSIDMTGTLLLTAGLVVLVIGTIITVARRPAERAAP